MAPPPPEAAVEPSVSAAWERWTTGRDITDPSELADHLEDAGRALAEVCDKARSAASARLDALEDRWRPLASRLSAWLPRARAVQESAPALRAVKAARKWLTDTANDLRNEALRPFAEQSAHIWNELRQESNVTLGTITLAGTGLQKRADLDVHVDGTETSALGVMSQGELHSLALAVFLPRALAPRTPFGFVIIDDPVQSMDPAKVDGLAKVLSVVAAHRQVIVFTHDTRLRESVFRLQLPATVMEVTRGERSLVRVRKVEDEVSRALADARAVAASVELPPDAAFMVASGLCRTALEAACVEVYRRGRLSTGIPHTEVEAALRDARTLSDLVSLAAFGERRRRDDVQAQLERIGPWAVQAYRMCNRGVHGAPSAADLNGFVRHVDRLTRRIRDEW
ncbi:AAA family ATPase [Actinomadura rupiterrae]|uniref:AAA family ATPase n=1 Tax=Actinomadura rupiterrae TaxID=559627 RepID=UPI0020A51D58|nr:AAA family ATPase [Actinomadura rupiterrae]MCP2339535.1 hypothetical protein [Actinomadura rupiterrae]